MYNIGIVSWSCLNEVIKLASIGFFFILPSSYCEMQKTMNILIWYWQIDILQTQLGIFFECNHIPWVPVFLMFMVFWSVPYTVTWKQMKMK